MVRFVDDAGAAVPLASEVSRIVSLVPSLTEALAVSCPEKLVAATDWCTHPADLVVARVGGTKNPDLEAVGALAPDLVVASDEENRRDSQVERELLGFPPSSQPRRYQRRPSGWGQAPEHEARTTFVDISRPSHPRVHSQCATSCPTGSSHRPGSGTASEDTAGRGMFTRAGVSQAPPVEHPARLADSQGAPLIANCCRSVAVDLRRHRTGVAPGSLQAITRTSKHPAIDRISSTR